MYPSVGRGMAYLPYPVNPVDRGNSAGNSAAFLEYLRCLPHAEVEELSRDEQKMEAFLALSPAIKQLERQRDEACAENERLGNLSLQRESGLASARESLAAAGGEVRQSHAVCEDLLVQHRRLSEAYNPRVIKDKMATEVQSTDEQSEKLAEDFLRGNVPVENFLSGFLAIRKKSHLLRAKEEKLASQLKALDGLH